mmetsp:Transcript_55469/g.113433  ORF Transcript_55469/g.113433 Transcript_55469/m.113433 type:complete len:210 (+) Transcript_55469:281-910(+)
MPFSVKTWTVPSSKISNASTGPPIIPLLIPVSHRQTSYPCFENTELIPFSCGVCPTTILRARRRASTFSSSANDFSLGFGTEYCLFHRGESTSSRISGLCCKATFVLPSTNHSLVSWLSFSNPYRTCSSFKPPCTNTVCPIWTATDMYASASVVMCPPGRKASTRSIVSLGQPMSLRIRASSLPASSSSSSIGSLLLFSHPSHICRVVT